MHDTITVDEGLRLRPYDGEHSFALPWYQDAELVYLVDGVREPYSPEKLARMYAWLNAHGELYWIEVWESGAWRPIGDVTFSPQDMPIVIGEAAWRGRGVGRRVVGALIRRARRMGLEELHVREIYRWNEASQRLFEGAGFRPCGATENGSAYVLHMMKG